VTNKADLAKALLEIEHTTGPVVIDVPMTIKIILN
jgi:thiamine pyrophosphate-dependent acetolactate synthase large subunit-like protein